MKANYRMSEDGNTIYVDIFYKHLVFTGEAKCHPQDMDMKKFNIGWNIAEPRAEIKLLKHIKNNEIKPKLEMLEHLKSLYDRTKKSDKNSYEYLMVKRQIRLYKNYLTTINEEIAAQENYCKEYIRKKEEIYQKIRNQNKTNE